MPLYVIVSGLLGVLSNFTKPKRSALALILVVYAGGVMAAWPHINLQRDGVWQTIWTTGVEGPMWYLFFSLLFGGVPFSGGRYGYQFVIELKGSARG